MISQGSTQFIQYGWGGTSLGCPIFTAFWALANQKAGHALGQAAPLIAALPYGGVQDILPITDSTAHNVTGGDRRSERRHHLLGFEIFVGLLEGNKSFTSAIWPEDSEDVLDFGFGLDSSLTVRHGWDNATGFGTPYGLAFINAVNRRELARCVGNDGRSKVLARSKSFKGGDDGVTAPNFSCAIREALPSKSL